MLTAASKSADANNNAPSAGANDTTTATERLAAASAAPATLCSKLRVPAVSRLQKMHNVNLVLTAMRDAGVLPPDHSATPKKGGRTATGRTATRIGGRTVGATPTPGTMAVFDVTAKVSG